jgi:hypothetical protein
MIVYSLCVLLVQYTFNLAYSSTGQILIIFWIYLILYHCNTIA